MHQEVINNYSIKFQALSLNYILTTPIINFNYYRKTLESRGVLTALISFQHQEKVMFNNDKRTNRKNLKEKLNNQEIIVVIGYFNCLK